MRRHKYGVAAAELRTIDGVRFDSRAEARYYLRLKLLVAAGELIGFDRQVLFELGQPPIRYKADFVVNLPDGTRAAHEVKGVRTPAFKTLVRFWKECGPMPLVILTPRRGGGWQIERIPGGSEKASR